MRLRRRPSPLLLLLLPSLANCLVTTSVVAAKTPALANDANAYAAAATPVPSPESAASLSLRQKGTKDAPVDGKDGKPHAGPFVDTPSEKKSSAVLGDAELVSEPKATLPPLKNAPADPTIIDGVRIPQSNDGVMDDKTRQPPKVGTTGTEGGVSEKDKARKAHEGQTGERLEKVPETPKEKPPLPHSEQEKLDSHLKGTGKGDKDTEVKADVEASLAGLEKPTDLPDKPHDIPHPVPVSANKDHLDISKPGSTSSSSTSAEGADGLIQPLHSYLLSMSMILVSEIGDKTFLVAALMAMKHDRLLVFTAAFSALIAMTVLSAVLGHAVPTLLPKKLTNFGAAILFLFFGAKLLKEGLAMSPDEGVQDEMQEVEEELREKEHQTRAAGRRRSSVSPYSLESGMGGRKTRKSRSASRLPSPPRSPSSSPERYPQKTAIKSSVSGVYNLFSFLLSPAWVQTFVMTFLGEWGDRSQIATIAMAAGQDYWWVTAGAVSGHAVCTGVAVIGGRAIAGKVSMRVVTLGGAIAFLIFGVIYTAEAFYFE